jgi:hypothetical protein
MPRRKIRSNRLERVRDRSESGGDGGGKQLLQLALMIMVLAMLLAFWGNLSKGAASCYANLGSRATVAPVSAPRTQSPAAPEPSPLEVVPGAK